MGGSLSPLATRTTTHLLDALRESGDAPVWAQLDARYRPVIGAFARRLGLNPSDAEEVAQRALAEFAVAYRDGRYDRGKGRLSSWILGIAHHTGLAMLRQGRRRAAHDDNFLGELADAPTLRSLWEEERDREILAQALAQLRESEMDQRTLLAFELSALRGVPSDETAAQTGMTVEQVYVARSRVTKKLRLLVQELTTAFEEDA